MRTAIRHEFVDAIPECLDDGVVYISLPFATAMHRCCCGCGHDVVTPLHPRQWSLIFDGESISLTPSIGNWSFPCRSHYWIRAGRVLEARSFTRAEIAELRADQQADLAEHFAGQGAEAPHEIVPADESRWRRLLRWLGRRAR